MTGIWKFLNIEFEMVMAQVSATINTILKHHASDDIVKSGKNIKIYNYSMAVLMWDWFVFKLLYKKGITWSKYDNDAAYLTKAFDNTKCNVFSNVGIEIGNGRNNVISYNIKDVQILYKKFDNQLIVYFNIKKESIYCPNVRRKTK